MKKIFNDELRLRHIMDSIEIIEKFMSGQSKEALNNNEQLQSAIAYKIQIIGEASGKLSQTIRDKHSYIEWSKIISLRNIIVHEYFELDADILYLIIETHLPELKTQITTILQELQGQ